MYSAKEISEKLINDGFSDMTVRKVNYYAFEKKMFPVNGTGKSVFSDADYDKFKSIAFLRENSKYSLEEIKEKIQNHTFQEIDNMLLTKTIGDYTTRNSMTANTNSLFVETPNHDEEISFTTTCASTNVSTGKSYNSSAVSSCTSDTVHLSTDSSFNDSNSYGLNTPSYTGTPSDFLRSNLGTSAPYNSYPSYPSIATQVSSKETDAFEEKKSNGKTRVKISKGIFIEYDETADQKEIDKLINMSKILFE